MLNEIFVGVYKGNGIGYGVLTERTREVYVEKYGEVSTNSLKQLVNYCKEMRWIIQDKPKGNYFLHPYCEVC